ncbi:hypothetical protein D9M69_720650 [compost metagenome]
MVLGATGLQHVEVFLLETLFRVLVDGIKRVYQTIAESIGIDVERRMNEVRNIGPEGFITRIEMDSIAKAFALNIHPDFTDTF